MNLIFMGTPEFCLPSLEELNRHHTISAVVTQPDRKANRGHKVFSSPVKRFAERNGIDVLQPEKVRKDKSFAHKLTEYEPDIIIVIAFGQILPEKILNIPEYGCVNIHASLLPLLRGASPIQHAIIRGYEKTGVTSMMMNNKMDEGDILLQYECPVTSDETAGTLHDKLAELSARACIETIAGLERGSVRPVPQDHSGATYTSLIKKSDGKICWDDSAEEIMRCFRAMNPWPGSFTYYDGNYIKILEMTRVNEKITGYSPGEVISLSDNIMIACGDNSAVNVSRIQLSGRRAVSVKDFLNGSDIIVKNGKFEF
ncbi:MAG: methionyl-tRNA formyltransferase [Candidatus Muiribacteriaceae bacterium]